MSIGARVPLVPTARPLCPPGDAAVRRARIVSWRGGLCGMTRAMPRALPSRSEILQILRGEGRALHSAELAARLGVRPASRRRLRDLLEQLVLDGSIGQLSGDRFRVGEARSLDGWDGVLS